MAGERILVVDDGADMRDFVIKYVLKPNGYEYLEARDGLEGFDQIMTGSPDLVLMDLQMPRLDGFGLLRRMREENVAVPVVLMTFYGSEEIAIEVFRLGVRDYVIKPFTEEELLGAIERALTVTRLRREREELTEKLAVASREFQKRMREFQSLYRIGKLVASLPDAETLMLRIVEAAAYLVGTETAALLLMAEQEEPVLAQRAFRDTAGQTVLAQNLVENVLAWRAIRSGQAVASKPQQAASGKQVVEMCAPLITGGIPLGALSVTLPAETASEHHLQLLAGLADYAAIGIELARRVPG